MPPADPASLLDTISDLALAIARRAPDCADDAKHIASLAAQLQASPPDRGAIQDALDSRLSDADGVSDLQVRSAADAVVKAVSSES